MANLEGSINEKEIPLDPIENKEVADERMEKLLTRCEHNPLQLCKTLEGVRQGINTGQTLPNISIQEIAEVQKVFPEGGSWKLSNISIGNKINPLSRPTYNPDAQSSKLDELQKIAENGNTTLKFGFNKGPGIDFIKKF